MSHQATLSLFDADEIKATFDLKLSPIFQLSTEEKVERAKAAILAAMRTHASVLLASSFGKDSSVLVHLVLSVQRDLAAAGEPQPLVLITHADTGIDNPEMTAVARGEIARVQQFAAKHGLRVQVDIASPAFNESWAVRIASGRALPTFVNSSSRDCSISWKAKPQERQRKQALKRLAQAGSTILMTGVRLEESPHRQESMLSRGESDCEVWTDAQGRANLSPIAYFSQEDVWVVLASLQSGRADSYTDGVAVWQFYQDAGNSSCAVVGDDFMKANAKACGARAGCALCAAVGVDSSMEAMLASDPKFAYMRPLNNLQRFLVNTQYDVSRRQWVGRTITSDGFVPIAPDVYAPSMLREILSYAITIDRDEARAARELGIEPRFQLVTLEQAIGVDVIWSINALQPRAFEAIRIWKSIYEDGQSFYPPEIDPKQFPKSLPAPKWLYVGADWDSDLEGQALYSGARSLSYDLAAAAGSQDRTMNVEAKDGRLILAGPVERSFIVSAQQAYDFMTYEIEDRGLLEESESWEPHAAWLHYKGLGIFSTFVGHQAEQDAMARRGAWRARHGINTMSVQDLLSMCVTSGERAAGLRSLFGVPTLGQIYQARRDAEHARRKATLTLGRAAYDVPLQAYMAELLEPFTLRPQPLPAPCAQEPRAPVQLDLLEAA